VANEGPTSSNYSLLRHEVKNVRQDSENERLAV